MNPYLADILSQPAALRQAIHKYTEHTLAPACQQLSAGRFDRLILTGMGASYNSAYPAYIQLCALPVPVMLVNTAELVHFLGEAASPRSLVWMISQSGRSAEILHLLAKHQSNPPAFTIACGNDETSPLAKAADAWIPIHAGPESSVSTKTYLNSLATNLLAAGQLTGYPVEELRQALLQAADAIEVYLHNWQARAAEIDSLLGEFSNLFILGRGASLSSVWNGALINKEAARCSFEGMHAADFRHGPLELAGPGLCAMIFAGSPATTALNRKLALELLNHHSRVVWLDSHPDPDLPTALHPDTPLLTRPLGEILPMELLTLVMAQRKGIPAGQFRVVGKVTAEE